MLSTLINRRCTIVRRSDSGRADPYGKAIQTETLIETVCELQQQRRDEQDAHGETSDTLWSGYFLAGADVRTGDAFVVDGVEYQLVGEPWPARNPRTQQQSHVEATARRTAGDEDAS